MVRIQARHAYFIGIVVILSVLAAVLYGLDHDKSREYINPGSPRSPIDLSQDFFESATDTASSISLETVIERASYPILLRVDETKKPLAPLHIWINPQTLRTGIVVDGYSIRYADRIQLQIDPTDNELKHHIDELLNEEMLPNTRGERRINFKTEARNTLAIAHERGEQKWESGDVHRYPSVLQWTEKGQGDVPFILYTLYGDCTVEKLQSIAKSLKPFD